MSNNKKPPVFNEDEIKKELTKTVKIEDFTIDLPWGTLLRIQHIANTRKIEFYDCAIELLNEAVDVHCKIKIIDLAKTQSFTEQDEH
jgi:hypothetical protein